MSVAAVSRFVNHKQRFTPAVEARIQQAVVQVGYRGNPAARSMVTGRSGVVAALITALDNPHAAALVKGLCRVALAERYDLLFVDPLHGQSPQAELERVLGMQVDGLVIAAAMPVGTGELLARYGRPFIDLARGRDRAEVAAAADADAPDLQAQAGALIARYLLRTGHRRISFVGCAADATCAGRLAGVQQALAGSDARLHVAWAAQATAEGGAAVASSVLLAADRPDAVLACNDPLAMGLLAEARLLGVAVPDEVSLAGIENMPAARYLSPALTSVDLHADALGAAAMTRLLAAIRGQPEPVNLDTPEPRLWVRESTRARGV